MFERLFSLPLDSHDSFFIFGPRGTGKTRWLKSNFNNESVIYFDFLDSLTYRQLKNNPERLSEMYPPDNVF